MTSSAYRISSKRDPNLYTSIQAYIKENAHADNRGRLCQVLQRYADTQTLAAPAAESDDVWHGFPWLTMVFGSGALELQEATGLADGLARAVENYAKKLATQTKMAKVLNSFNSDGNAKVAPAPDLAYEFTRKLAVGRLGGCEDDAADEWDEEIAGAGVGGGQPSVVDVDDFSAGLVLLAALLTRLYYTAQQRWVPPVARFDGDVAALSQTADVGAGVPDYDATSSLALISRLRNQARRSGVMAVDDDENENIKDAVEALLSNIDADLSRYPRSLTLGNLRLVTEVGWYLLTLRTPIYAGWTDLMLFLTMNQGGMGPAPLYRNLKNLPKMVKKLHEPPTRASRGLDGGLEDKSTAESAVQRDRLYGEAANVLWAQGDAASQENRNLAESGAQAPFGESLPPAVAFVTSFDIELDLAMWWAARKRDGAHGKAFRVVLPLHLMREADDDEDNFAELCWVMGEVDAMNWPPPTGPSDTEAELEYVRAPRNWRLVTDNTDESVLREMPIIVHLNGCPLYEIPKFDSAEAAQLRLDLKDAGVAFTTQDHLDHAVTIGEYLALRQSETELIWHRHSHVNRHLNRSLHRHLMISTQRNPRYWVSMGVPVADAAVRHRLVSQLTRERLLELTRPSEEVSEDDGGWLGAMPEAETQKGAVSTFSPRIGGVAVNLRTGADAAGLLYWAGLDLVQGDCNQLAGELRHYAAHVRDPGSDQKKPGEICTLDDTRRRGKR